ncbi:MAG TPA: hypothetical protein VEN28_10240 [Burkholderiaceae bacterium]|nr:hypothetical protein [Burkholderiaceae bacterium]
MTYAGGRKTERPLTRQFPARLAFNRMARVSLAACLSALTLLGLPAEAAESDPRSEREFFGLLRARDLTPFGLGMGLKGEAAT